MNINSKEFMLKESIRRVANGGYTDVKYDRHAIMFIWTPGHNPLEVAGREASSTRVNETMLNTLANLNEPMKLVCDEDNRGRYMIICSDSYQVPSKDTNLPSVTQFENLLELLKYVRKNMSSTGRIVHTFGEEKPQEVYINPWGLYKESYSNAEVVEILNNFKAELIESIGQLSNRLVDRIQK